MCRNSQRTGERQPEERPCKQTTYNQVYVQSNRGDQCFSSPMGTKAGSLKTFPVVAELLYLILYSIFAIIPLL